MAIPTQPTTTTIVTEALKLLGRQTPATTLVTRATDYGLEMVKSDLMDMGEEWDFLRTTSYQPLTVGVSKYQAPTDFKKLISVRLLDGVSRGTAQTGAAGTITLASTEAAGSEIVGKEIVVTSGTGANQCRQIKSYVTATKVATLAENWTTTPDSTSVYLIVDSKKPVRLHTIYPLEEIRHQNFQGSADNMFHDADSAEGDFILDKVPDVAYALEIRYYADLLKIDITVTLYDRILRLLNGLFIQGVFVWALQDDNRYQVQRQIYEMKLQKTAGKYLYPNNLSDFQSTVDY